jgi:6-phosphogluconolactonase (cycloisomerase 2 family)
MRTGQGFGRFSSGRRAFRNVVLLVPALVLIATMLNTSSCSNNGLLPQSGSGSQSPTATPTSGTGALAFVTNFNDGKVSSFTRNLTTGVLKRTGQVTAGAKKGPMGLVGAPSGSFLYVANNSDGNIYQFSINATTGVLTPLSPAFVSNGSGSGPDEIAINSAGSFLWVTGGTKGTVTPYSINTSTGQLTQITTKVTGLTSPIGITVDPTSAFVYVADTGSGLVYAYSINTDGTLTQIGSPVSDLGGSGGSPAFIAVDPGGGFIYVTDLNAGVLAVLKTVSGALSFFSTVPTATTSNKPIGIGYGAVPSVGNFVFTANQAVSTVWTFLITSPGFPSTPVETSTTDLSAPTGLVVDPQVAFLYVTNQDAGTVSQFQLTATCLNTGAPCLVGSIATESPANANSGPYQIILAQ